MADRAERARRMHNFPGVLKKEAAAATGVDASAVSRLIRSERKISEEEFARLQQYFRNFRGDGFEEPFEAEIQLGRGTSRAKSSGCRRRRSSFGATMCSSQRRRSVRASSTDVSRNFADAPNPQAPSSIMGPAPCARSPPPRPPCRRSRRGICRRGAAIVDRQRSAMSARQDAGRISGKSAATSR